MLDGVASKMLKTNLNTSVFCCMCIGVLGIFITKTKGRVGFGPGEQEWGFVEVRPGAYLFYWLYFTTAPNIPTYHDRPLAIWLQGGPGASSTGFGNFDELGPLDVDGNYRNSTWVKDMNVLFIDNPVGAGFSYVTHESLLATNNHQIAMDLVEFMKQFYAQYPEFRKVPLHIFTESYGGKMAPEFAWELHAAIQRQEIICNLKSVVLGDPWTSPIDSMLSWAPFLLSTGLVDYDGYQKIMASALRTQQLILNNEWEKATALWSKTEAIVLIETENADFYNIAESRRYEGKLRSQPRAEVSRIEEDISYRTMVMRNYGEIVFTKLEKLMRGPVSKALGIPLHVKWGQQSAKTFSSLSTDFMKPVVHFVERLLNETDIKVGVLSGQFDLICATLGTINWIERMKWNGKDNYRRARRHGIMVNYIIEGYEKSAGNFYMFWVNYAGHMVPADNPIAMNYILKRMTNYG